jgi:hypothetical protein
MTKLRRVLVITATSAIGAMAAMAGSISTDQQSTTVRVQELHPFTHLASIPADSDLSSIKFESVKKVNVATRRRSVIDVRYCEETAKRDSGDSMRCPSEELEAPAPAYEVTYSYHGQPLASDEDGDRYFRFSVYLREDELSPAVRKMLSEKKPVRAAAKDYFSLNTSRETVAGAVIDEAASTFCEGNFVDGSWARTDRRCVDKINTKASIASSAYITVRIDSASPESATNPAK